MFDWSCIHSCNSMRYSSLSSKWCTGSKGCIRATGPFDFLDFLPRAPPAPVAGGLSAAVGGGAGEAAADSAAPAAWDGLTGPPAALKSNTGRRRSAGKAVRYGLNSESASRQCCNPASAISVWKRCILDTRWSPYAITLSRGTLCLLIFETWANSGKCSRGLGVKFSRRATVQCQQLFKGVGVRSVNLVNELTKWFGKKLPPLTTCIP